MVNIHSLLGGSRCWNCWDKSP